MKQSNEVRQEFLKETIKELVREGYIFEEIEIALKNVKHNDKEFCEILNRIL